MISRDSTQAGVYVGRVDAPGSVRLLDRASAAAYAPPGFLLDLQQDLLMAQPFDAARLSLTGRPVLLARGLRAPSLFDGHVISGSREMLAFREGASSQQLTRVYVSDESGIPEVYVRRYPGMDDPQVISAGGGGQPQWRADQKELFYLAQDRSLMAVAVHGSESLSYGAPRRLFRTSIGTAPSAARDSYAVMSDGQSFLIDGRLDRDRDAPITMMLNWAAGLPHPNGDLAGSVRGFLPARGGGGTSVDVASAR